MVKNLDTKAKDIVIVKIQLSLTSSEYNRGVLVYNESNSFVFELSQVYISHKNIIGFILI